MEPAVSKKRNLKGNRPNQSNYNTKITATLHQAWLLSDLVIQQGKKKKRRHWDTKYSEILLDKPVDTSATHASRHASLHIYKLKIVVFL